MSITKTLAVVPVEDFEVALEWYGRLFGRPADAQPMAGLADWHLSDSAWVQLHQNSDSAGKSFLNFAVDDLQKHTDELAGREIALGEVITTDKGAKLAPVNDPDGNTITFIENPSV
ncbi:VOC family protein [Kribbella sp. NBC_01245]|uniref:VOC family protein n=1 Tax=Kribbella sp. NBC_01245 TaxID=2903578 RepID=UPI002E28FCC7|nr:VOC family protein [Kribbella sp. NBC_01245]